jgi:hypothetical protein
MKNEGKSKFNEYKVAVMARPTDVDRDPDDVLGDSEVMPQAYESSNPLRDHLLGKDVWGI